MPTIENQFLRVCVDAHGAELCSIFDKTRNHEVIWNADPAYWQRHAPVLFPFVGKVNKGAYRYKGISYSMGQHGFARDMDFTLESADEQSITFCLTSNEETLQKYPFPFELRITHTLDVHTLKVTWEVRNPSLAPMYFSIGGHPAFNVPADREQHRNDYYVQFKGSDTYSYILIDPEEEAANPDQPHLLETDDGILPVTDHLFDNDALIFDNGQVQQASILYPDRTPYVTLSCKGFPSFGLWSKPHSDAPYICLEPWIGRVDNIGFDGELPDKYGEMELAGGDVFTASYTIEVH